MANLLYLVHRLPYPPNKGDKVRSYHLLCHLLRGHRVHLGTFVDDPDDEQHLAHMESLCASFHAERLDGRRARLAALAGLLTGEALSLHYYRSAALARWVDETVAGERIDAIVVFSSSMAQYAQRHPGIPMLVDFVDVDSAKWAEYAPKHRWPLSWIYGREGRTLLRAECEIASAARASYFVTEAEVALFRRLAPGKSAGALVMGNGVDAAYFDPEGSFENPFADGEVPIVFTGTMNHWPNVDAVSWFATEILPALAAVCDRIRFHVGGRSPLAEVRALAGPLVSITGTVSDIRPFLQHAAVVVSPVRVARGIKNKILEAMAMARPVVATGACVRSLEVTPGVEALIADEPHEYAQAIRELLQTPSRAAAIGAAGRQRVVRSYDWGSRMAVIEQDLARLAVEAPAAP